MRAYSPADWNRFESALPSVELAVGCTPLIRLERVTHEVGPPVYVKLESHSPTGSSKDRPYLFMFSEAEARGELKAGMTVLEAATGSSGVACAFMAARKGYKCSVIVPSGVDPMYKRAICDYGASLIEVRGGESDVDLALIQVAKIAGDSATDYWMPAQFANPDNSGAHYRTTAPELWKQTQGSLGALVASVYTGGTVTGVGKYLRDVESKARIYAVEPAQCPLLSQCKWGPHEIDGIAPGFVPPLLDLEILSGVVLVTDAEAREMRKRLLSEEGIPSSLLMACNVVAAIKVGLHYPELPCVVCVGGSVQRLAQVRRSSP